MPCRVGFAELVLNELDVPSGASSPGGLRCALRGRRALFKRCALCRRRLYAVQVASREMPIAHFYRHGLDLAAIRKAMRAPRVEWAA